jgi:mRNA interferase YafQ
MRAIKELNSFKRDIRRVSAHPHHRDIRLRLAEVLSQLCADAPLHQRHRDHPLSGVWRGSRDCHLKPDLVLIYRKVGDNLLELVRLGSHSELFRK